MAELLLSAFQYAVFLCGVVSLSLAIRFAVFFSSSNHHLSKTMMRFLVEQIVSSLGTLLFSISSLMATITGMPEEMWNATPPLVAITIRMVMFAAMIESTSSLSMSIQRVVTSDSERDEGIEILRKLVDANDDMAKLEAVVADAQLWLEKKAA